MFNGLKTWQKAILITVFSVIGAFMTAWSQCPVDIHALNDKNDDAND